MTTEERIIDLERQLQEALINERQIVEMRLRLEGAVIAMKELLKDETIKQSVEKS